MWPISLPIRRGDDGIPGDGFVIRHGFACENTIFQPGLHHCAEDFYARDGAETAGAQVLAMAPGEVVFVGSNYPGRVIVIRHDESLYSQYGHLAFEPLVVVGDVVATGQQTATVHQIGTEFAVPSHLHVELRTFLYQDIVNGEHPEYGFNCGYQCAPGPGYWPLTAPQHPAELGWRNPTHQLAQMLRDGGIPSGGEVVVSQDADGQEVELRTNPADDATVRATTPLVGGTRLALLDVAAGDPAGTGSSALAYDLWYLVRMENGDEGWILAAVPSDADTGSDGRPSGVRLRLLPMSV